MMRNGSRPAAAAVLLCALTLLLWSWSRHRGGQSSWTPLQASPPDDSRPPRLLEYDWVVERRPWSADGVVRDMITVNGRFPGPTIQAVVGDEVSVRVLNRLPTNISSPERDIFSTSIAEVYPPDTDSLVSLHWHGLSMRGSPHADGATGFTSCSIPPGQSHTYRFRLGKEDAGTHWWHSHVGMARSDGLWGALVVNSEEEREALRSQASVEWDDEHIITVGDHYHRPGAHQLAWFLSRHSLGFEPPPESSLINGRNVFDCAHSLLPDVVCHGPGAGSGLEGSHAEVRLDAPRRHRLRIINTGALADQILSVDAHTLTVIEADGQLVQPVTVQRLAIAPGQRYSVILNPPPGHDKSGPYWLRSEMDPSCFNIPNPALNMTALAIVDYSSSTSRSTLTPHSKAWVNSEPAEGPALVPLSPNPAPPLDLSVGDIKVVLTASLPRKELHNLSPMGYLNRTTWRAPSLPLLHSYMHASLEQLSIPHSLYDPRHHLVVSPHASEDRTVELVIHNKDESAHPFHLHGHKFWIMEVSRSSFGWGAYVDNGQASAYRLDLVPHRDTVNVPRRGYAVIRWRADNPGVWAMHCHVLLHMAAGMAMAFVEKPALLPDVADADLACAHGS